MISKKELMQSKKGLLQLRGMLVEKRSALKKEMGKMGKIVRTQESPAWVDEVREEYAKGWDPKEPFRSSRVLKILRKHKVL